MPAYMGGAPARRNNAARYYPQRLLAFGTIHEQGHEQGAPNATTRCRGEANKSLIRLAFTIPC